MRDRRSAVVGYADLTIEDIKDSNKQQGRGRGRIQVGFEKESQNISKR
jgi:hypothetical protein